MPSRPVNIALGVSATVLTLAAGYAAWFDYKRQTDKHFRNKLRKDNKKIHNHVESVKSAQGAKVKQDLVQAVIEISAEPTPRSPEESERYFMENVSIGERLSSLGPEAFVPAAISFYRALRIYPAPAELMQIYSKTVLPPVFEILRELISISNTLSSANISTSGSSNPAIDALAAALAAAGGETPAAASSSKGLDLSEDAAIVEDKEDDYEDVKEEESAQPEIVVVEEEKVDVVVEDEEEEVVQAGGETVGEDEEKIMLAALQAALSAGEAPSA